MKAAFSFLLLTLICTLNACQSSDIENITPDVRARAREGSWEDSALLWPSNISIDKPAEIKWQPLNKDSGLKDEDKDYMKPAYGSKDYVIR